MIGYTSNNLRAVVDAIIPETPDLAAKRGEEHEPGATAIELEDYLQSAFNNYQEVHAGPATGLLRKLGLRNVPFALIVSLLLDFVAIELLIRQDNEDSPRLNLDRFPRGGVFVRLSRRDRLRAIGLLEDDGVLPYFDDRLGSEIPQLGSIRFLAMGLHAFPMMGYYSEWSAKTDVSDSDVAPESVQGWEQTGYPGPADGYAEFSGYEVDQFRENDY